MGEPHRAISLVRFWVRNQDKGPPSNNPDWGKLIEEICRIYFLNFERTKWTYINIKRKLGYDVKLEFHVERLQKFKKKIHYER